MAETRRSNTSGTGDDSGDGDSTSFAHPSPRSAASPAMGVLAPATATAHQAAARLAGGDSLEFFAPQPSDPSPLGVLVEFPANRQHSTTGKSDDGESSVSNSIDLGRSVPSTPGADARSGAITGARGSSSHSQLRLDGIGEDATWRENAARLSGESNSQPA